MNDENSSHSLNGILLKNKVLPFSRTKSIKVSRCFSLDRMIKCGKYNHVNSGVTQKHFQSLGNIHGEYEYKLFHFGGNVSSEFANTAIVKAGQTGPWEWAYGEHLLAFGMQNPGFQRKYPIVALNAVGIINGSVQVMCLFGSASYRSLDLVQWNGVWESSCQFLAVRKLEIMCRRHRNNSKHSPRE